MNIDFIEGFINELAKCNRLSQVAAVIKSSLQELTGSDQVEVFDISDDGQVALIACDYHKQSNELAPQQFNELGQDLKLAQLVADKGKIVVYPPHSNIDRSFLLESEFALPKNRQSFLGVPMLLDNQLVGVLLIFNIRITNELANLIQTLKKLSNLSATIVRTVKFCEKALADLATIKLVNRVNSVINSSLNFSEVYQAFAEELKNIVKFDRICIAAVLPTTGELLIYAVVDNDRTLLEPGTRLPITGTAMEDMLLDNGQAQLITELKKHSKYIEDNELLEAGMNSLMRIPLISKGNIIGYLSLAGCQPEGYDFRDLLKIKPLAEHVAVAVSNAQLYEEVRQRNRSLAILNNIAVTLNERLDLKLLFSRILKHLLEATQFSSAIIYLNEQVSKQVQHGECRHIIPIAHAGISAEVMEQINHYHQASTFELIQNQNFPLSEVFKTQLKVPLNSQDQTVGLIILAHFKKILIAPEVHKTLWIIGRQIGVAVEHAALFQEVQRFARYDELTGLYNRREFYKRLEEEVNRSQRYHHQLSLLMLDVDNFKKFNDEHGHLAGDKALKQVAACINQTIRKTDLAARYGGEELSVILPETGKANAIKLAERLRRKISQDNIVTVSIGVATLPEDAFNSQQLVAAADKALYQAKAKGRNKIIAFDKEENKTG